MFTTVVLHLKKVFYFLFHIIFFFVLEKDMINLFLIMPFYFQVLDKWSKQNGVRIDK